MKIGKKSLVAIFIVMDLAIGAILGFIEYRKEAYLNSTAELRSTLLKYREMSLLLCQRNYKAWETWELGRTYFIDYSNGIIADNSKNMTDPRYCRTEMELAQKLIKVEKNRGVFQYTDSLRLHADSILKTMSVPKKYKVNYDSYKEIYKLCNHLLMLALQPVRGHPDDYFSDYIDTNRQTNNLFKLTGKHGEDFIKYSTPYTHQAFSTYEKMMRSGK